MGGCSKRVSPKGRITRLGKRHHMGLPQVWEGWKAGAHLPCVQLCLTHPHRHTLTQLIQNKFNCRTELIQGVSRINREMVNGLHSCSAIQHFYSASKWVTMASCSPIHSHQWEAAVMKSAASLIESNLSLGGLAKDTAVF